jgi:site-specific recombinase XerD
MQECSRDLAALVVPQAGRMVTTDNLSEPYQLLDPDGVVVEAVAAYLRDLQAAGRAETTARSYTLDLLRWFRFLWAPSVGVRWDRATRIEARDFCRWLQLAGKPQRQHWRHQGEPETTTGGRPTSGRQPYAASVRAHSETVLRGFYDFHRDMGTGPILNPFPLDRARRGRRAHAHRNPMDPPRHERTGFYRPTVATRVPRSVPDTEFNEIFARLPSHRDRALVAFYVSTGARASELLSATQGGVDPGRQLITVVRKGSRAIQELPASSDAFVWLRLYQVQMQDEIPRGRRNPLWWTLRAPARPLTYHAAHRMFERVNARAGTSATLHSLRHTAAYRMAQDPALPLTDVQFVLGHSLLTTTQIYLTPRKEEVIRRILAHHAEQNRQAAARAAPSPLLVIARRRWRFCSGTVPRDLRCHRPTRDHPGGGIDAGRVAVRPHPGHELARHVSGPRDGLGTIERSTVRAG